MEVYDRVTKAMAPKRERLALAEKYIEITADKHQLMKECKELEIRIAHAKRLTDRRSFHQASAHSPSSARFAQLEQELALVVIEEETAAQQVEEVTAATTASLFLKREAIAAKAMIEKHLEKAVNALNSLNKYALGELKGLATPPDAVLSVTAAVAYMIAPKGANLKKVDISWGGAKQMIGNVNTFLKTLQNFDKDNLPPANKAKVLEYTGTTSDGRTEPNNPKFNYDFMKHKSSAAAGLCEWVVNMFARADLSINLPVACAYVWARCVPMHACASSQVHL